MLYEYFFFMELFSNNQFNLIVEMSIQRRSHDRFVLKRYIINVLNKMGVYPTIFKDLMGTPNMLDNLFTISNLCFETVERVNLEANLKEQFDRLNAS